MLETVVFGVLLSVASEVITWINKVTTGTLLQGKGSMLLALVVTFVGAAVKVVWVDGGDFSWDGIGVLFAQYWVVAQVFFVYVVDWLKLDVQPVGSTKGVW